MSAEPVSLPPIHWSAIPGNHNPARFAAMAVAHSRAYNEALVSAQDQASHRDALSRHYHPMIAALAAVGALNGWSMERIDEAIQDGADVDEWCWQWLTDAGVSEADIERFTWDLNAPGVITSL